MKSETGSEKNARRQNVSGNDDGNHNGSKARASARRPNFLARIFGFGIAPEEYTNGQKSHTMTSDGVAVVNIDALMESDEFKRSASSLQNTRISPPQPKL